MELPHIWHPASRVDISGALGDWFGSDLGRSLLGAEKHLLGHILPDLFGYHALQVGQAVPDDLLESSRIRHRVVVDTDPVPSGDASLLRAAPGLLPLAANSIDVVLLHHYLDLTPHPHAVLREAARVLMPEGHLVILGFNPWSLWGFWRLFRLPWASTPWLRRVMSPQRLADWLSLLDFEVVGVESAYFRPPVQARWLNDRLGWLDQLGTRFWSQGGATYAVLARKRVACMTPLRLREPLLQMLRPALAAEARDAAQLKKPGH